MRARVRLWGGACPRVGNRRATWRERQGLLLEVFDQEGRRGVGEATPLPGFSGDSLEECQKALEAWCRALPLKVNMADFAGYPAVMPSPPAARFAVESALLDAQGKRGEPPVPVTGLFSSPRGGPIYVSKLLYESNFSSMVEQLRGGVTAGFHTFKLKVGGEGKFADDLRLVRDLRQAVPGSWRLRLDANGSWDLQHAPRYLEQLANWQVELVEDPVPPSQLPHLGAGPIPIAADEALKEERLHLPLLRSGSCQIWVLKPTLVGGFRRCRELSLLAKEFGVGTLFSHSFEGPVGLAAVRAVARLWGWAPQPRGDSFQPGSRGEVRRGDCLAHGVDLHPALAAFPPLAVPGGAAAELDRWEAGGLGVEP